MVHVSGARVERRSMTEQAANIIRELILGGELKPGQPVTHEDMSNRLGVSTMPVREALIRLSHEGFIEARHGRTFRVAPNSREDIEDVYWIHGFLAGELAARACERGGPDLVEQLQEIANKWNQVSPAELYELEVEFHGLINRAARSPKLVKMLEHTVRFMPRAFFELLPPWREESTSSHVEIIEALIAKEGERVRDVAELHASVACDLLLDHFETTGLWDEDEETPAVS